MTHKSQNNIIYEEEIILTLGQGIVIETEEIKPTQLRD